MRSSPRWNYLKDGQLLKRRTIIQFFRQLRITCRSERELITKNLQLDQFMLWIFLAALTVSKGVAIIIQLYLLFFYKYLEGNKLKEEKMYGQVFLFLNIVYLGKIMIVGVYVYTETPKYYPDRSKCFIANLGSPTLENSFQTEQDRTKIN